MTSLHVFEEKVLSLGGATPVNLPFKPSRVEMENLSALETPAADGVPYAWYNQYMTSGQAGVHKYATAPAINELLLTSGGFSFFDGGLPMLGGFQAVASITKADPAVVTSAANHGLVTGDVVVFQGLFQSAPTGMPQICTIPFVVTVTGATTFTIDWNTNQSEYTALTSPDAGAGFKKVSVPYRYVPGVNFISAITLGATTLVKMTTKHNFRVGQEVGFRIPVAYGTTELNSLPNETVPGSPVYYFVTGVPSETSVVVNALSTGFTSFKNNVPISQITGLNFPQIFAVGTVNQSGWPYTGEDLYPSAIVNGVSVGNGPVVQGAFLQNTHQGVVLGAAIAGSLNDVLVVRASLEY